MHSGFRFTELYCFPVNLRDWAFKRLINHFKEKQENK